jgi:hypothetical protein
MFGVTNYKHFKEFPFLESDSIKQLKNMVKSQIRDNYRFGERTLLLGEPGIGKSTALYYVYDMLTEAECAVFMFDKFFADAEDFQLQEGVKIAEAAKERPIYLLVDFPDTINSANYKKFLDYINTLMRSPNSNNINFVFACNISHFSRSLTLSEILNKFFKFRFDRMTKEECEQLIRSRLRMTEQENFFDADVYEIVHKYSRGIPRNIICASKVLVDEFKEQNSVSVTDAKNLLKEEYIDKIINDREENPRKKVLYKGIMKVLMNDLHGEATNQTKLVDIFKEKFDIGKNRSMLLLSDLHKFGLLEYYKAGRNNTEKIWSVKI